MRSFVSHCFYHSLQDSPTPASAQTIPFMTDDEIRMLSNELSGDRAFEHIRILSQWHRNSGMDGYFKAADYIMKEAKAAGLEDVKFIDQPLDGNNYTAVSAELRMVEPVDAKLADIGEAAVYLADGSSDADITAELIWIGDALNDSLGGLDVAGKIVLTGGSPGWADAKGGVGEGAVGVVSFQTSESRSPMDAPDQIAWLSIPITPPEGKKGTFAFVLPPRKGEILKKILQTNQMQDLLATGKKTKGGKIVLRAKVDTEIGPLPGRTGFVEAWIRGSTHHDQQIVLTAHLQEEKSSEHDGSGCANPESGALEKPRVNGKLPARRATSGSGGPRNIFGTRYFATTRRNRRSSREPPPGHGRRKSGDGKPVRRMILAPTDFVLHDAVVRVGRQHLS